jgi:hypothetical protein
MLPPKPSHCVRASDMHPESSSARLPLAVEPSAHILIVFVSEEAQHWNTPKTMPPLVISRRKLTFVHAFQHAAPNSPSVSFGAFRVRACDAEGDTLGKGGMKTQIAQDATAEIISTSSRT